MSEERLTKRSWKTEKVVEGEEVDRNEDEETVLREIQTTRIEGETD